MGDLARSLEVEIKVLSPGDLKTIACDEHAFITALRALVKNALEHTPAGGEVRIEVHRKRRGDEPWLELTVADTGEGITEDDRGRVLEPFWQGTGDKRGGARGVGLGLAIADQVARRHQGHITIVGGEPTGTRISITIPQQTALE